MSDPLIRMREDCTSAPGCPVPDHLHRVEHQDVIMPGAFRFNVGKRLPVRGPDGTLIGTAEVLGVDETPDGPELRLRTTAGHAKVQELFQAGQQLSIGPFAKDPE